MDKQVSEKKTNEKWGYMQREKAPSLASRLRTKKNTPVYQGSYKDKKRSKYRIMKKEWGVSRHTWRIKRGKSQEMCLDYA